MEESLSPAGKAFSRELPVETGMKNVSSENLTSCKKTRSLRKSLAFLCLIHQLTTRECNGLFPCIFLSLCLEEMSGRKCRDRVQNQPHMNGELLFTSGFLAVLSNCFPGLLCLSDKTKLKSKILEESSLICTVSLEELQTNTGSGWESAAQDQHCSKGLLIQVWWAKTCLNQ